MNCDMGCRKADADQTPQKSDTTGVALHMQGHRQPHSMMHRLQNASL